MLRNAVCNSQLRHCLVVMLVDVRWCSKMIRLRYRRGCFLAQDQAGRHRRVGQGVMIRVFWWGEARDTEESNGSNGWQWMTNGWQMDVKCVRWTFSTIQCLTLLWRKPTRSTAIPQISAGHLRRWESEAAQLSQTELMVSPPSWNKEVLTCFNG